VYHALLTRKYLTTKIMPLLASLAVMLCTGMVIVVWSVMGGFLRHLVDSGRSLVGDVVVDWPNVGFPHYDELIRRLEARPEIEAASPAIVSYALCVLPDGRKEMVMIRGIDGASFERVTGFDRALYWKPTTEPARRDTKREDPRLNPQYAGVLNNVFEAGRTLTVPAPGGVRVPAVVPGIEVTGYSRRSPLGFYSTGFGRLSPPDAAGGERWGEVFTPKDVSLTLHCVPVDSKGNILDVVSRTFPVANEFQTGVYEVDRKTVLVEFAELQRLLKMDAAGAIDAATRPGTVGVGPDGRESFVLPNVVGVSPARATTVYVRGKGEVGNAEELKAIVTEVYTKFAVDHPDAPAAGIIGIGTWRDQNRMMIAAVEKETGLVLILFSFISVTAVFLVLAIFWSMVAEKTKDIGILRALGASRSGVAWLWIRYGLAIGVVGALGGGTLAYFVVTNINEIHEWIGQTTGTFVWDPRVYYFSEIPARFKWFDASIVVVAGVLSSGIGAFVPALRAARLDPVRALRFE